MPDHLVRIVSSSLSEGVSLECECGWTIWVETVGEAQWSGALHEMEGRQLRGRQRIGTTFTLFSALLIIVVAFVVLATVFDPI